MLSLKEAIPRTRYHKKRGHRDTGMGRNGDGEPRRWGDAERRATCIRSVRNLHRNHSSEHNASKEGWLAPAQYPFHSTLRVGRLSGGKPPFLTCIMGASAISMEPECRSFARCFVCWTLWTSCGQHDLSVFASPCLSVSSSRAGAELRGQT